MAEKQQDWVTSYDDRFSTRKDHVHGMSMQCNSANISLAMEIRQEAR